MAMEMTKKERLLQSISEISFVAYDLLLYLDTHPCDELIAREYEDYQKKYQLLINQYANAYGPLLITQITDRTNDAWTNQPWPWEGVD